MGTIDLRGDGVNTEMETGSRSTAAPIVAHRASWSEKFRGTPLTEANQAIQAYAWTVGQLRYAQLPHSPTTQPQPDISFATQSGHLHLLLTITALISSPAASVSAGRSGAPLSSIGAGGLEPPISCSQSKRLDDAPLLRISVALFATIPTTQQLTDTPDRHLQLATRLHTNRHGRYANRRLPRHPPPRPIPNSQL